MKISPEFIEFPNDVLIYPKDRQGSKIDFEYFIQQTSEWIARYATYVDPNVYEYDNTSTCLATFVPDNGFIIDRLPSNIKYNSKIVMYAAGWGMKFAPVFAEILTHFVLGTESTSPYAEYLPNFSLNIPGRIINSQTTIPPVITTTAASTPVIWKYLSIGLMAAIALLIVLVVVVLVYRRLVNRNAYLQT
jgi:hypothetical protein